MTEQERQARALVGFMDEQDALNFLKGMGIPGGKTDEELKGVWKEARVAVEGLAAPDLTPEVLDIDNQFSEQLDAVSKDPLFTEAVQQKKWSFKLVEIDKLVCFQKFVYTDHAENMAKEHDFSDTAKLIEFCLSEKASKRPFAMASSPQEYMILSPSQDLRILGPVQMQDPVTNRSAFGFGVGWGTPFIQVAKFKDKYFLKNGYHRVYAIRKKGVTHVPCILIESETLAEVGFLKPGFFEEALLMSDKPPVFANFFAERIAPTVRMKPLTKIVRVTAKEEALPVILPAVATQEEQRTPTTVSEKSELALYEDFKIEKEDWNIYKLSDGSIIRLREVLLKVNRNAAALPGQPNLQVQASNLLIAVHSPAKLKGHPSPKQYTPQELAAFVVEPNMKYKTVRALVNEYVTSSGIKVLLQLASINVGKTDKYDANGDPQYLVNAQINIQIIPPDKK